MIKLSSYSLHSTLCAENPFLNTSMLSLNSQKAFTLFWFGLGWNRMCEKEVMIWEMSEECQKKCACVCNNTAAPTYNTPVPRLGHMWTHIHSIWQHVNDMRTKKKSQGAKVILCDGDGGDACVRGQCELKQRWNGNKTREVWSDEGWERHMES